MKTVLMAGGSGLVGSLLLRELLHSPQIGRVVSVSRAPLGLRHEKLTERITDFDGIEQLDISEKIDMVFSCLGTTRAKTPDKQEYFRIEHDYPLLLGRMGLAKGATQFHYISSMGANSRSINIYARNKGIAEQDLSKLGYGSLYLYRPSLITGLRKEYRGMELFFGWLLRVLKPLMTGPFKKNRSILAITVAKAMLYSALHPSPGNHVLLSDEIERRGSQA